MFFCGWQIRSPTVKVPILSNIAVKIELQCKFQAHDTICHVGEEQLVKSLLNKITLKRATPLSLSAYPTFHGIVITKSNVSFLIHVALMLQ